MFLLICIAVNIKTILL